jgi:crotonobetainyl-CoA:carnitine CoA-transferase CaiB-like acyl-CoA transferase
VFDDPQIRHLGLLAEVAQPTYEAHGGKARMLGFPFRASATPASIRRPAPLLGEHTEEVLIEVLGLPADEVARLAEAGTIGLAPPDPGRPPVSPPAGSPRRDSASG